ncbi:mediator of RNA polymerase II transcription subunit 27 isoform X2 [Podarcis raffonei]|uniref:mediator of RNA polymerase II transcription subunit 27 isoform X2 n=1 Tax=Podarcis raffonei TaxID=65483 RepID=UPI0023293A90|nr:mediator of RNA polymerase II transcription subunit 27 isoform X2 [Podarcis raffonei]
MADGVLSAGVNLEAFAQAISAIQALRSSVTRVFDCLKDGRRNKEALEGREKSFVSSFQESLHSVSRDLGELERLSNLVGKPSENHPLHNSGLLSLDPVQDKTPLYSQLLQAYKWSNKLQYHAGLASGLLNQQSLKRSANQMGVSAKRRPKAQPTTLVLPPQYVDDVISRIDRMFPEMSIHLSRPNGTSAMLLVTLGKVLKVIVVMRSLFIDRTIVKGYHENVYTDDGKPAALEKCKRHLNLRTLTLLLQEMNFKRCPEYCYVGRVSVRKSQGCKQGAWIGQGDSLCSGPMALLAEKN